MTITSSDSFDSKLDKVVELAKEFHKKHSGVAFSIEYSGWGTIYFSFVNDSFKQGTSEYIQSLCDTYGMSYNVVPSQGKLVVTIQ